MTLLARVDHLVYATPDLQRGMREIELLVGISPTHGGQHFGLGTRNALVALGPSAYLEIIGPDPEQPPPDVSRWFGIDELEGSRLTAWCVKERDLEGLRKRAVERSVPIGAVKAGARYRPDGVQLSWRFTDPFARVADGIVPFFIDWGDSPHPASSAAVGHATLVRLRAVHPKADDVRRQLDSLGLDLPVKPGKSPALIATLAGAYGPVDLR